MFTLKPVSFSWVLGALLCSAPGWAQTIAPVETLSSDEMAKATGKFAGGAVVGVDLVMRANWQDAQQGNLGGELRVQVKPGAANPITVQSSSQSQAGTGPAPSGAPGVIEGGIPRVQGIAQGNQISGFDNQVSNQFEVTVLPDGLRVMPSSGLANGNSQANSAAGQVQAGVDGLGVGIRVKPAGGGGTTQRVGAFGPGGGSGGVQQWAQVPGNQNHVRLSTALELHMRPLGAGEAANRSTRQAIDLMPMRMR